MNTYTILPEYRSKFALYMCRDKVASGAFYLNVRYKKAKRPAAYSITIINRNKQ